MNNPFQNAASNGMLGAAPQQHYANTAYTGQAIAAHNTINLQITKVSNGYVIHMNGQTRVVAEGGDLVGEIAALVVSAKMEA